MHRISTAHPYEQMFVKCNNLVIQHNTIQYIYGVKLFLKLLLCYLRTPRFPEIKTCELTQQLGGYKPLQTSSGILGGV
jgi:hypothetical protein